MLTEIMASLIAKLLQHHEPVGEGSTLAWTSPAAYISRTQGYVVGGRGLQPDDRFYVQTGVKVVEPGDGGALLFMSCTSSRCAVVDPAAHSVHEVLASATVHSASDRRDYVTLEALDVSFTLPLHVVLSVVADSKDPATVHHADKARDWFASRRAVRDGQPRPLLSESYDVVRTLSLYIAAACRDKL